MVSVKAPGLLARALGQAALEASAGDERRASDLEQGVLA